MQGVKAKLPVVTYARSVATKSMWIVTAAFSFGALALATLVAQPLLSWLADARSASRWAAVGLSALGVIVGAWGAKVASLPVRRRQARAAALVAFMPLLTSTALLIW